MKEMNLLENTEIAFASKSDSELRNAYWLFKLIGHMWMVRLGKGFVNIALFFRIPFGWVLKKNLFHQFCGGESNSQCADATKILDARHVGTILDFSVEGKETEADFERTFQEILGTIKTANGNPHIPFCVFKSSGIARLELLEKMDARRPFSDSEKLEFERVENRVDAICKAAFDADTPIFVDAEESWMQDTVDRLVDSMMERYNQTKAIVFNTAQMYRHDRLAFIKASHKRAMEKGYRYGVKLVRGAYMEKERERAEEMGYPSPIQPDKESTDRDFNAALKYCVENIELISCCAGSHNEESAGYLISLMHEHGIDKDDIRIYFAQLFGMSDHITFNLANQGYNVAKYVPYGPIQEVVPYLIRRAEENTSVGGQASRELSLIAEEIKRRKSLKKQD